MNSFAAIILSAGQSSRMGRTKALLVWQEKSFLEHIVSALRKSAVCSRYITVTGFDFENVASEAKRLGVEAIHNPQFSLGLMGSLQAGLRALKPDTDAVLVVLADQPQLEARLL